ncbi:MAG: hypothetical protein V3U92_05160 [Cellulophaga sp.]
MAEEYLTLDKEYLEKFNLGYSISQETGLKAETLDKLKSEQLAKMNISKNHMDVIKQGMKQHAKDKEQGFAKGKSTKIEIKDKSKAQSKDKDLKNAFDKIKKEREENERNKDKGLGKGFSR